MTDRLYWKGDLELGDGWAVWRGLAGDGELHRHFAAQAVFAPEPVAVFDGDGRRSEACCVLIDPLTAHRLASASEVQLVYLEPSRQVLPYLAKLLSTARKAHSLALVPGPPEQHFWAGWLSSPNEPLRELDPRVATVIEALDGVLTDGSARLEWAARTAKLSPDRFRHLFAEEVGLPYRRYLLWRRLRLAAAELLAGHDATTAAHTAGFADAAHFARTLKSTFGVTASHSLLVR